MTSSSKRPWFRFHLLTAVMMMIAAGALLSLEMKVDREPRDDDFGSWQTVIERRGFPMVCWSRATYADKNLPGDRKVIRLGISLLRIPYQDSTWRYAAAAVDVLVFILALFAVAGLCESILRSRGGTVESEASASILSSRRFRFLLMLFLTVPTAGSFLLFNSTDKIEGNSIRVQKPAQDDQPVLRRVETVSGR